MGQGIRIKETVRGGMKMESSKEADINGEEISTYVREITMPLLNVRGISRRYILWLGEMLFLSKDENVKKTSTTKDVRKKEINRLV